MDKTPDTLITTNDGSYTLHSSEYDENMHSLSGAYEEALLKHVAPSRVLDNESEHIAVLDVGFGIGYNTLALLDALAAKHFRGSCDIVSFEKNRSFLPFMETIFFHDDRDKTYSFIKKAYRDGESRDGTVSLKILFGDARESIRSLSYRQFDAIFFDPYSPSHNPELWSVEFFRKIFRLTAGHGVLTTYSSAPQIRAALIEAGFIIGRGPSVGGKREGTLAAKSGIIPTLSEEEIRALKNNRRAVPYRDVNLTATREDILHQRLEEIKKLKGAC